MFLLRLIARLPFPLLYLLSWLGYLLVYYVTGYRKAVVKQNLQQAFPDKSATEITVLSKKFYRHLLNLTFEVIKAHNMSEADFGRRMRVVNPEMILAATQDKSRSVIVLTLHQGNWEWMLHGASLAMEIPIDPIYKPLHNMTWDNFALETRSRFNSKPIAMEQASRNILKHRRNFRLFVMVADQAPIERETTYWTDYLNKEAAFYQGGEKIAQLTGFPVFFAQCRLVSTGHYELEFSKIAEPPHNKRSHDILDRYVALAEAAVREQPHTFLWSNRRWKRNRQAEERPQALRTTQDSVSQSKPSD
jgi:KDO2-lipid IV(A) lauroyltransferase